MDAYFIIRVTVQYYHYFAVHIPTLAMGAHSGWPRCPFDMLSAFHFYLFAHTTGIKHFSQESENLDVGAGMLITVKFLLLLVIFSG